MKFFKRFDITGPDGSLYLRRWTLVEIFGWSIKLHKIARPDYAREMHDHPWGFMTIILFGGYVEETQRGMRTNRPGAIRCNPPHFAHAIRSLLNGPAWTLVFCTPRKRAWGFWTECGWMPWRKYCDRVYGGLPVCEEKGEVNP